MEHISKRFGDFYANKDICLSVAKGEVHTLLGENGAGKSTLMNILIGLYQPTEGKIFLNGKEERIESPSQAVKLGIGMVHQHFMLVEAMTVFENIILGDRNSKGLFIDRAARRREIEALAEKYGLDVELDKLITEISVGAQQRVEILKALYHGAELLILDEPSAALTDIEVEGLFAIMKKLISEGKSIIFISHKMREVLHISDRITILRAGEVVTTVDAAKTPGPELANLMIGRELADRTTKRSPAHGRRLPPLEHRVQQELQAQRPRGHHAAGGPGEIVGIAGVDGNGQTQLAQIVTGVLTPEAGELDLKDKKIALFNPSGFIDDGVSIIPEDRNLQGLVGNMTVADNLVLKATDTPQFSAQAALAPQEKGHRVLRARDGGQVRHPLRVHRSGGAQPLRRQPAEGHPRARARVEAGSARRRPSHARPRHRRDALHPRPHDRGERARRRDPAHQRRLRRDPRDVRPHPRHLRGPAHGRVLRAKIRRSTRSASP
jgi:simple sugar transport system ATP-binding protein